MTRKRHRIHSTLPTLISSHLPSRINTSHHIWHNGTETFHDMHIDLFRFCLSLSLCVSLCMSSLVVHTTVWNGWYIYICVLVHNRPCCWCYDGTIWCVIWIESWEGWSVFQSCDCQLLLFWIHSIVSSLVSCSLLFVVVYYYSCDVVWDSLLFMWLCCCCGCCCGCDAIAFFLCIHMWFSQTDYVVNYSQHDKNQRQTMKHIALAIRYNTCVYIYIYHNRNRKYTECNMTAMYENDITYTHGLHTWSL